MATTHAKVWFRSLLRPKVNSVMVEVYENGRIIRDFSEYPKHKLIPLMRAVNALWQDSRTNAYWFETELFELQPGCWSRKGHAVTLHVSCYRESRASNDFKSPFPIPPRYMNRMLEKRHRIYLGNEALPTVLEVKFTLLK